MTGSIPYIPTCKNQKHAFGFLRIAACLLVSLFVTSHCLAGEDPEYDEIPVFITVPGLGSVEIPAVIFNENIYLSVTSLFDFLKIRNTLAEGQNSISGFFINPQSTFLFDKKNDRIVYKDKSFDLQGKGFIITEIGLYLRSDYFGQVFGLQCIFNFRSLSVVLNTTADLPAIRELRQEAMRNNLRLLRGELKADTNIYRNYPLFHFGMADWSVITMQDLKGTANTLFNLSLGGMLAGGETNISLNYNSGVKNSLKQQYYLWRHVNNESRGLKQLMAGKIATQAVASVYAPVVGIQFTNTPTTFRRSFGSYVLSDHTEPNWMVELYVNNVMVNYVRADASGFFTFEVPLVYGNSVVKIRYYGPWGEERTTERIINIPFNFLPKNQFEYTVNAGVVEDSSHSKYSRVSFNFGMGRHLTIGGGVEYLSSVTTGKNMPFVNASARLGANLLVSGEYIYGVRMKNVLSYRLPSNLQFELSYSKYKKGQTAINNTYLEERRAMVSFPFRTKKFSLFSRLTLYQVILPSSKYTIAEALFSGIVMGVSANLTTYGLFNTEGKPYMYSNLSSTFRLPSKITLTPQLQYEFSANRFIGVKTELAKPISARGFVNINYENNFKSHFQSFGIGFRYELSYAQIGFSARHSDHNTTLTGSARGSLVYDGQTNYLGLNNRTSVGKGGIVVLPYLDLNGNEQRDRGEPKVDGLRVQVSAGRVQYNTRDTAILISDLEAYASYLIKLNTDGFDHIAWQIKKRTLKVTINANQFTFIEVPVAVMGEVSGMVFWEDAKGQKGQGRILVNFYRDSTLAGQILTETDGYFNYSGLPPGAYTARIDPAQLLKLQVTAQPGSIAFTLSPNPEGDVVDTLQFILRPLPGTVSGKAGDEQ